MRSPAFRVVIGAAAWIAIGVAAFLLFKTEQQIISSSASLRGFDQRAREAAAAFGDARLAQSAYVAAGQGIGFWMPKVTASTDAADAALSTMRSAASADAVSAIDLAAQSAKEFGTIERRIREYLKTGQQLMAGDVIFTEGVQASSAAIGQIEAARLAEHQAFDASVAALRKQEAIALATAGAVVALIVLVLMFAPRTAKTEIVTTSLSIAAPIEEDFKPARKAPPPPAPEPTSTDTFKAAATLVTDFGRLHDLDDLTRLLGRAADVMDASGVMVWMGTPAGADLRPVLAHGYSPDMVARIPPVPRSADNAAAMAYRSGTLQIVLARPGKSTGAVVAPILSANGCMGALSAEIRHGAETSETTQALATIFAAQLATVVTQTPPAEIDETQTAAQG
jgi:hypothetical protein